MPSDALILPAPVLLIALMFLVAALALTLWRALVGPSLPDRVMSLDLLGAIFMGGCLLLALASGRELYMDVAMAVAVVAFLGTLAFARQIEDKDK